jgi:hypothetical protein
MTQYVDIERALDEYYVEGRYDLSDSALDEALATVSMTPQRRALRAPWRNSHMPVILRLAAVAALVAAALGAGYLIGGNRSDPAPQPPTETSTETLQLTAALGGRYTAQRPASYGLPAGVYELLIDDPPGSSPRAHGPAGEDIVLGHTVADGRNATFGKTDRCSAEGTYRYGLDDNGRTLTIETVGDPCVDRRTLLEGIWDRLFLDVRLVPGQRYELDMSMTQSARTTLSFVPPNGFVDDGGTPGVVRYAMAEDRPWIEFHAGYDEGAIITGGTVPTDRCDQDGAMRSLPTTLDEFVEWNRAAGVTTTEPVRTTIDGHAAVYVDVKATGACQTLPGPDCSCMTAGAIWQDGDERVWAIDLGDRLVVAMYHDASFPVVPLTDAKRAIGTQLVESLQFE